MEAPQKDRFHRGHPVQRQYRHEAIKDRTLSDGFERVAFDYYEQLQETLVDMIPDFRIRLKVDPRTREMVFEADVHSVFDICWFTLAKKSRML